MEGKGREGEGRGGEQDEEKCDFVVAWLVAWLTVAKAVQYIPTYIGVDILPYMHPHIQCKILSKEGPAMYACLQLNYTPIP